MINNCPYNYNVCYYYYYYLIILNNKIKLLLLWHYALLACSMVHSKGFHTYTDSLYTEFDQIHDQYH